MRNTKLLNSRSIEDDNSESLEIHEAALKSGILLKKHQNRNNKGTPFNSGGDHPIFIENGKSLVHIDD